MSLADFLVIIAEAAMARAHGDAEKSQALYESFRDGFKWGRQSVEHCEWNEGRMPNPENGCHGRDGKDGLE